MPVYHAADGEVYSKYIGHFSSSLVCLLSHTLRADSEINKRINLNELVVWGNITVNELVVGGGDYEAVRLCMRWMVNSAAVGKFVTIPVSVDDSKFPNLQTAASILNMPDLKASLNKRVEVFNQEYYSLTDVRLAYDHIKTRDAELRVAHNIGAAFRDHLILDPFSYRRLRVSIPQFGADVDEWFAQEKSNAQWERVAREQQIYQEELEKVRHDARNGLIVLPEWAR